MQQTRARSMCSKTSGRAWNALGPVRFGGGFGRPAGAGSLLLFTPPFFWPSEAFPYRWFFRAGGVYKHITDTNPFIGPTPVEVESGVGLLLGAGVEVEFTKTWFGRIEYEYLSKIGTLRAINVQHTPISASIGAK